MNRVIWRGWRLMAVASRPLAILALLLLFFAAGAASAAFPERSLLILPLSALIALVLATGNRLYDILLWACPLAFLLAQFQLASLDLMRWVLLLLLALVSAYWVRGQRWGASPIARGIAIVALYSVATSYGSYYPSVSFAKGMSLFLLAGFLLFVPPFIRRLHPRLGARQHMLRMYLWLAIAVVISNALSFLVMPSSAFLAGRFRGWFVNPNGIGAVYGIFFIPILAYEAAMRRMGPAKLGMLLVCLLASVELLASQSRAGISAGVITLCIPLLARQRWPQRLTILATIALTIVVVGLAVPGRNPIQAFVYRNETVLEGSGRFPVWAATWQRFLARPVFGSGLGVTDTGDQVAGLVVTTQGYSIEKGSSYLGTLEEFGIVGTALVLVALLVPVLRACWRGLTSASLSEDRAHLALIAIAAGGLANAAFEAWLLSVGSFLALSYWIFISLLLSSEGGGSGR